MKTKLTHLEKYQQWITDPFYTVDPGARKGGGTAIIQWKCHIKGSIEIKLFTSKEEKHEHKVEEILADILNYLKPVSATIKLSKPKTIFIERPQYFDTYVGQTAARSESLFKLIYFYGRLFQLATMLGFDVIPLEINHWKGQLSKQQVSNRVERICGKKYKGDICDAVGMGLYLKGLL